MSSEQNQTQVAASTEVAQSARYEGQQLTGVVKYYSLEKGYGFITCDDQGGDVFCHQSAIQVQGFRCLIKGTPVSFIFTVRQGKDTATEVKVKEGHNAPNFETRLAASKAFADSNRDPNAKEGKVKWFDAKKGFGFIVPKEGTKDVFVHIGQVDSQTPLMEDDDVEYSVTVDEQKDRHTATGVRLVARAGQPVAAVGMQAPQQVMYGQPQQVVYAQQMGYAPQVYDAYEMGYAPQVYDDYGGFAQQAPQPNAAAATAAAVSALLAPGQKSGTVKWYNVEKGFGFLVTTEGKDMYVNKAQLDMVDGTLTEGETVIYEEQANNGKVWATKVQRPQVAPQAQYMQAPQYAYAQQQAYPQQVQYAADPNQYAQAQVGGKRKGAPGQEMYAQQYNKNARVGEYAAPQAQYEYMAVPQEQAQYYQQAPDRQQQQFDLNQQYY